MMKKISKIILYLAIILSILIGLKFLKYLWLYEEKIVGNICVSQVFRTDTYNISVCKSNKILVQDVNGWIVESEIIYGSSSENKYFGFILDSDDILTFESLSEINIYLANRNILRYNISDEENISHFKYDNGRNRKYGNNN